jgi:hypothetical protein
MERLKETLRDFWLTWSIYIMIPVSLIGFAVALYYMFYDVL